MRDTAVKVRTAAGALLFLLVFEFLLSIVPALAEEYAGKVVAITDGDTFTLLLPEKQQVKVRLAQIDTPERNQLYGSQAREALSDLVFQHEVRAAKRGLWALPEAQRMPPWEWRQASRSAKPRASSTNQASLSCGAKRTCKQMQDCAKARFYLNSCGLTRLDDDGDGVPCESLCR